MWLSSLCTCYNLEKSRSQSLKRKFYHSLLVNDPFYDTSLHNPFADPLKWGTRLPMYWRGIINTLSCFKQNLEVKVSGHRLRSELKFISNLASLSIGITNLSWPQLLYYLELNINLLPRCGPGPHERKFKSCICNVSASQFVTNTGLG